MVSVGLWVILTFMWLSAWGVIMARVFESPDLERKTSDAPSNLLLSMVAITLVSIWLYGLIVLIALIPNTLF